MCWTYQHKLASNSHLGAADSIFPSHLTGTTRFSRVPHEVYVWYQSQPYLAYFCAIECQTIRFPYQSQPFLAHFCAIECQPICFSYQSQPYLAYLCAMSRWEVTSCPVSWLWKPVQKLSRMSMPKVHVVEYSRIDQKEPDDLRHGEGWKVHALRASAPGARKEGEK